MKTINEFVIGVGSNIDPEENVKRAEEELKESVLFLKKSSFIYTEPLLFQDQAKFLNGAFLIRTAWNEEQLQQELKDLERKLGRVKTTNKNGPRTIDLDIVVRNNSIVDDDFYKRDFLKNSVLELLPELPWQKDDCGVV